MLTTLLNPLFSLVYPQHCHVCRQEVDELSGGVACSACWAETRLFCGSEALCAKCGAVLSDDSLGTTSHCRQCENQRFGKARAVGIYEKALSSTILALKHRPELPRRLLPSILDAFEREGFRGATSIIPVPLSRRRKFERGYNQAQVIAEFLAKSTGTKLNTQSLRRKRNTPMHRVGMDQRARELTLAGAFEITAPRLIEATHVVLIDDVFTSGSTASACAAILKKNGASEVDVFTLARATLSNRS